MPNITQVPNEPPDVLKMHTSMKQNGCLLFLCKLLECAHSEFLLVTMWKDVVYVG